MPFFLIIISALLMAFLSPSFALATMAALVLLALSWKRVEIGLYVLTAYIPLEPFLLKFASDESYPYLKYGSEVLIFCLFIMVITRHFARNGFKYIKTPLDIPLLIFVFLTALSALVNLENPTYWLLGLRQLFRYVLLYYIVIYSRLAEKTSRNIVKLLIGLMLFEAAIGIGQTIVGYEADKFLLPGIKRDFGALTSPDYVSQFWNAGERIFATMGRYDRLGTFLAFVLLLVVGLWQEAKEKIKKNWLLVLTIIILPALALTYSRLSWIGFLLGFLVIVGLIKKNKKIILGLAAVGALFAIYLGIYVFANEVRVSHLNDSASMSLAERTLSAFSMSEITNSYRTQGRLYFIVNTPAVVVKDSPFLGVGLGQYGSGITYVLNNTEKYDELNLPFGIESAAGQIDNNWFSLWGETGTLGVLAFAAILINLWLAAWKFYHSETVNTWFTRGITLGFLGIIVAVSFEAFLGPYFEIRTLSYNFWLVAGLVINEKIKSNDEIAGQARNDEGNNVRHAGLDPASRDQRNKHEIAGQVHNDGKDNKKYEL